MIKSKSFRSSIALLRKYTRPNATIFRKQRDQGGGQRGGHENCEVADWPTGQDGCGTDGGGRRHSDRGHRATQRACSRRTGGTIDREVIGSGSSPIRLPGHRSLAVVVVLRKPAALGAGDLGGDRQDRRSGIEAEGSPPGQSNLGRIL